MNIVEVRNAFKHFGNKKADQKIILNQLNMTVAPGTIYGLMGASGCGKTTLLSCIIGMIPLDKGKISVFGNEITHFSLQKNGKRIGYMPQEMALINDLTVKETIYYFGTIFQMDIDKLRDRYDMLYKLLELPPGDHLIQQCSGGEMRRISFAASMIHDPELLILDEPTVGLDPLLREKIWHFMMDITRNSNISIIITTHYIEEAKQADCIGLMRNGILLAEDKPLNVMNRLNVDSLEEAFLNLCLRKGTSEEAEDVAEDIISDISKDNNNEFEMQIKTNNTNFLDKNSDKKAEKDSNMRFRKQIIYALIVKHVLQLKRQPLSIITMAILPFLQLFFFHYSIGSNPRGLKIGIVDDEIINFHECHTPGLIHAFKQDYVCYINLVSCRFLTELTDDIAEKVFYTAFEDAFRDAKDGKLVAIIYFDANFTESLDEVRRFPEEASEQTKQNSLIKIYMDQTDLQITTYIQRQLYDVYRRYTETILEDCDLPYNLDGIPIVFEKPIYGSLKSNFQHSMFPAFTVLIIFNVTAGLTIGAIAEDRKEGFWNRTLLAGVSTLEMLSSHILINIFIQIIQLIEIAVIWSIFFEVNRNASYCLFVLLFLLVGMIGIFFGLYTSCVFSDIMVCHIFFVGITQPMVVLSGLFWPIEGMPLILRILAYATPTTWPSLSVLNITQKGYSFAHKDVYLGFVITIIWIFLSAYLALKTLSKNKFSRNT